MPARPLTPSRFLGAQAALVRVPLALAGLCGGGNGILLIVQYWLLSRAVSALVFDGADLVGVWPLLWPILPLIVARAALAWGMEEAGARAAASVKHHVRVLLHDHLVGLGPIRLAGERPGDLAATLVDGVEALEPYYSRFLPAMMLVALVPSAILAVTAPTDWVSGLILALTAPLVPLFMVLIGKGAEQLNQRQWVRLARMSARFLESLQNLTTLKLFNASRREAEMVARLSEDYRVSTMAVLRVAFLSALALEFFATLGIALVAVYAGFRLLSGELDFQRGFFVLLLAPEFYLPLRSLGTQYHARMEAIAAATRLVDLLSRPVPARGSGRPAPATPPEIRFDSVRLAYADGRAGLDGADFTIAAGRMTALVGPTGAGKSSAVSLVLGFVEPDGGRILVDGTPLDQVDAQSWRHGLAWVPQRPHLFRGTVADNIRLGAPGADDEAVRRAAIACGIEDLLAHAPIGERGQGLSGGQARLVALARAILRDTPLLILDEPAASLDRPGETRVTEVLGRLGRGRTILVVAHRLETIRAAAHIVVLDRGRVAEQGAHGELMAASGLYAALVAAGEVGA